MKVSIVITILNSHEIVKRYLRYFKRLDLPDDVEIILIDDGSSPPLSFPNHRIMNLNIYPTEDMRPWTQACARNMGAEIAQGKYLLMTDIDHILSREAIMAVREFDGDKMFFTRYFAILDRHGIIKQDLKTLIRYGLPEKFVKKGTLYAGHHVNTFAIRKQLYHDLGGYDPKWCGISSGGNHGDKHFYKKFRNCVCAKKCKESIVGPPIYVFPGMAKCRTIDTDPLELFHNLTRG